MRALRFNLFMFSLLAILVFLQYRLWFESGGIKDLLHLKAAISPAIARK